MACSLVDSIEGVPMHQLVLAHLDRLELLGHT